MGEKEQKTLDFGIKFLSCQSDFCSFVDRGQMTDSDLTSEVNLSSQLSSRASDGLSFICTFEINYSSDQTSGNEEG
jgi:hypothetical protein